MSPTTFFNLWSAVLGEVERWYHLHTIDEQSLGGEAAMPARNLFHRLSTIMPGLSLFALLYAASSFAQGGPQALRGTWTATAGASGEFQGTWTAETSSHSSNAARGTWRLLGTGGEIMAQGTWSARKTGAGWQGIWTARVDRGSPLSGSWRAGVSDPSVRTFAAMLELATKKYVSGLWRSGRFGGNWWLQLASSAEAQP